MVMKINVTEATMDKELKAAIRALRAELLKRQQKRATVKYLAAHPKES